MHIQEKMPATSGFEPGCQGGRLVDQAIRAGLSFVLPLIIVAIDFLIVQCIFMRINVIAFVRLRNIETDNLKAVYATTTDGPSSYFVQVLCTGLKSYVYP